MGGELEDIGETRPFGCNAKKKIGNGKMRFEEPDES